MLMDPNLKAPSKTVSPLTENSGTPKEKLTKATSRSVSLMVKASGDKKLALLMDNFNMEILFQEPLHMPMDQFIEDR